MEAASLLALACLIGERALSLSTVLQQAVDGPPGLARLGIGTLLLAALLAAGLQWLMPGLAGLPALLIGAGLGLITALILLQRRSRDLSLPRRERLALVAFLLVLLMSLVGLSPDLSATLPAIAPALWRALALALALSLGLPAFAALAQRLDDRAVPGPMRPLAARVVAATVLALALGGLQRQLEAMA